MTVDFKHTATANRQRDEKADQLVEFMLSTRMTAPPETAADRRHTERAACGRRCSKETWDLATARWRKLQAGMETGQ